MNRPLIILRPEPGNAATSARARDQGLAVHSYPLFETKPVAWEPPEPARYVGVIMTSANAARLAGAALQRFIHLPLYAVGEVTAEAARSAGFVSIVSGDGDVERLLGKIATLGLHRLLHLSGADYQPFSPHGVEVERRTVYASVAVSPAPALIDALRAGGVVMLHSARAAKQFAALVDRQRLERARLSVAAISDAAAQAAGGGWRVIAVAPRPRDAALLDTATILCTTAQQGD